MCLRPCSHLLGIIRPEVANHQEHLVPFAVLHESLHEADGRLDSRCAFEKIEPRQSLAADGRDHRLAKELARVPPGSGLAPNARLAQPLSRRPSR